ncbi:hypothetical protein [Sharpea azabuensis]|uniref:hypothetical protein n=1 Tax=Sharpea azabuensis TaxID=322505 RepID=UPI001568CE0F|nr:hypothetical protein [Sharpea azabuensis]
MAKSNAIYDIDGDEVNFQGFGKVSSRDSWTSKSGNTYTSGKKAGVVKPPTNDQPSGGGGYVPAPEPEPEPEPAFDWEAYYAELRRQAQERANQAYERNMARIADAYDSAYGSLKDNLSSTQGRLNAARDKSMGEVRGDAEDSLRQAYINNMMTRRNLNQRLAAMGMNGGATETTMSSLENQYGKSRAGINQTLNDNIANLDSTYGDNLAAALQSFNSAKANLDLQRMQLENQAEQARQNAEAASMSGAMNIDGGYISALQAALANQGQYNYNRSQATNDFVAGNAQQAQSASQGNNYAMWMAQQLLSGGNGQADVSSYLQSKGYTPQTIQDIFRQLGIGR